MGWNEFLVGPFSTRGPRLVCPRCGQTYIPVAVVGVGNTDTCSYSALDVLGMLYVNKGMNN